MTAFEQEVLTLCATTVILGIAAALLVAFWYRPDRTPRVVPVFGVPQADYDRELHRLEGENFDLRQQLKRAHLLIDPLREQVVELGSERLAVVLQLEVERKRRLRVTHQRDWNRARVRNLTPPRSNVIEFPTKRAGAA